MVIENKHKFQVFWKKKKRKNKTKSSEFKLSDIFDIQFTMPLPNLLTYGDSFLLQEIP